ncbi:Maf family nucleotide pyrophosphatase [Idiomarina seosinensis]|uniref:Maf family protein n=1 Tax=Idiomarina seosinensis TaxID=281739 RepID=UPI00384B775C
MALILASASPRRRQLLQQICPHFSCVVPAVEEFRQAQESASAYVQRLALDKARAVAATLDSDALVLGADTLIDFNGQVLEKPRDKNHFLEMMAALSGQQHQVRTAVAVVACQPTAADNNHRAEVIEVTTEVEFGEISSDQAHSYWNTGEPVDKAGGYGIQGAAGRFVKRINGSYTGVVGLPLYQTDALLQRMQSHLRSHDGC